MLRHTILFAPALAALLGPHAASATDRAAPATLRPAQASESARAETIAIEVLAGREALWSGTLRIGPQYGSASFSQSTNEFAEACPGEPAETANARSSNRRLNFNVSRRNWRQAPDSFNINVNWVRPLPACEGEGTNTIGFNRVVEMKTGQTVSVSGEGGLSVRLTRRP